MQRQVKGQGRYYILNTLTRIEESVRMSADDHISTPSTSAAIVLSILIPLCPSPMMIPTTPLCFSSAISLFSETISSVKLILGLDVNWDENVCIK